MVASLMRMVGFDLQRQLARLQASAEDFKARTMADVRREAMSIGVTLGLVFTGLMLVLMTLAAALGGLYLWVEIWEGPLVALGVVGLTTALLAILMFAVAGSRNRRTPVERDSPAASASASPFPHSASLMEGVSQQVGGRAAAATADVLDNAADAVRHGSRETILAVLALAAVAGVVIGRRR
jgi:hypothetical protein